MGDPQKREANAVHSATGSIAIKHFGEKTALGHVRSSGREAVAALRWHSSCVPWATVARCPADAIESAGGRRNI